MINLIGDDVHKASEFLGMPNARLHLYGKRDVRAGRKMGHVTIIEPLPGKPISGTNTSSESLEP